MLTQTELILLSTLPSAAIGQLLCEMKIDEAMRWRRDIQIALTEYSRRHKEFDSVKAGALRATCEIEKTCRDTFRRRCLLSRNGNKPRFEWKREWEDYVRRASY